MLKKIEGHMQRHMTGWYIGTITVILMCCLVFVYLRSPGYGRNNFEFSDHLADIAITVDDDEVTLKEAAYYIMVIESNINAMALEYNSTSPQALWNVAMSERGESGFVSERAKADLIDACVRDCIYYKEAYNAGITLTEEEKDECGEAAREQEKYMTGKQVEVTSYTYTDMYDAVERVTLLKKYMEVLMEEGYSEEDLDVGGEYYEELKEKYDIEINDDLWEEIKLGEVTVN